MAWRVRMKLRKAPPGVEIISEKLEEFEQRMREALDAPMDDKRRNELSWPMHKIHYEKNRYLHDMHYKEHVISKKLLDYLVKEKLCDGKLIAKWRKQGYERLCSLLAITKSNTNFRTVSVCRTPLRNRTGQIMPNVMTGCVSCASGDGGPIWWDDPVPDIVKRRIAAIDPGKQGIVDRAKGFVDGGPAAVEGESADAADDGDGEDEEVLKRAKRLRESMSNAQSLGRAAGDADGQDGAGSEEEEIVKRAKRLRESMPQLQNGARANADTGAGEEPESADAEEAEILKRAKRLRESTLRVQNGESLSAPPLHPEGESEDAAS